MPSGVANLRPVQKELALDGDSVAKLLGIAKSFSDEAKSESEKAGIPRGRPALQNLSWEERNAFREKRRALVLKLDEKFVPQLKEALTPAQFDRVQQIRWQLGSSEVFRNPELAKMLDITKDQQDKMVAVNQEYQETLRDAAKGGGDVTEILASRLKLLKDRDAKITDVLTKEQKEKFTALKGAPFDASEVRPGRGGRSGL